MLTFYQPIIIYNRIQRYEQYKYISNLSGKFFHTRMFAFPYINFTISCIFNTHHYFGTDSLSFIPQIIHPLSLIFIVIHLLLPFPFVHLRTK